VPWVKTPDDILRLIDVYLVQTMAKRMLRYHYYGDGRQPTRMAELAALVGNTEVTDPWMEWLFSRTFFYPNPPTGIQDLMITGTDRDGMSPIGSYAYMSGEASGARIAEKLEVYLNAGGNKKFDLRDDKRYPKTVLSIDFDLRSRTAGLYFPRIGDVAGPDKGYAAWFDASMPRMERAWRWTKEPRFAWVIRHFGSRGARDEQEWAEIEQAAEKVDRAPWLEVRSRVLPGWCALLESGVEHDDFRFRRSVMLRVGTGYGHGHNDTFDLQIHAHGVPMTLDAGQRGGYSSPGDRGSRVHNTVVVDGKNWLGHSWARALADLEGAQYVDATGTPPYETTLYRRQVALIDVAEGKGSQRPLSPQQCGPRPEGLAKEVVTPESYVFDVFRVAGGASHIYCFHATVNDPEGPQPATNLKDVRPVDPKAETGPAYRAAALLGGYKNKCYWATAPDPLEATFHLQKKRLRPARIKEAGAEVFFVPRGVFDAESPDKFTRWRLFNAKDALVSKGDQECHKWQYWIPHFFVERSGENLESAFAAIVEPYAGEPFLASAEQLDVADNEGDARRAVALRVRTKNGHEDLCFADGRPEKTRSLSAGRTAVATVSGEFAWASNDAEGLRAASLVGGTRLQTPSLLLKAAVAERTGKVVKVDYLEKKLWIDRVWPEQTERRILEIGALPASSGKGYVTGYESVEVRPAGEGSEIRMFRGADYYRSRIRSVEGASRTVFCSLGAPGSVGEMAGRNRNFVASNEAMSKFWRADILEGDRATGLYPFKLSGPVNEADFAPENAFRLWEYGVGDSVRQSTYVTLRRVEPGVYRVRSDVDVTLGLKGGGLEVSTDAKTWQPAGAKKEQDYVTVELNPGRAFLRVFE